MNSKHYLVISGIVGGVIGSLLTALLVSPVTAQRDKFGEIECTKLTVVDATGKGRIILTTDYRDAARRPYYDYDEVNVLITATGRGSLHVSGEEGKNGSVSIFSGSKSGSIDVYDDSGESMVSLGGRSLAGLAELMEKNGETAPQDLRELKGYVEVYSKGNANGRFQAFPDGASVHLGYRGKDAYEVGGGDAVLSGGQGTGGALELNYNIPFEKNFQSSQLDLGVNEEGGYVGIKSKKDKGKVAIGFADRGGYVTAISKDATIASLGIDEHGGRVTAYGKDGKSATLSVNDHGGRIEVYGKVDGAAVMAINEYGNGAVSTWDKNGYRQK